MRGWRSGYKDLGKGKLTKVSEQDKTGHSCTESWGGGETAGGNLVEVTRKWWTWGGNGGKDWSLIQRRWRPAVSGDRVGGRKAELPHL